MAETLERVVPRASTRRAAGPMTKLLDAPADTRMMHIVHQALRRDLQRAQLALVATPPPSNERQRAIAGHVTWMMSFLRGHHRAEDDGLYPLVRQRDPAAAALLDAMHSDHDEVDRLITRVEEAAGVCARDDDVGGVEQLVAALDRLSQDLLPHLQREEDEMMPIVSSVVTAAEWRALEHKYNLESKSFVELGREGHWLIDDASAEDRQSVLDLVSPVPRFILLHGFAHSYRRHAAACWSSSTRARRRVQKTRVVRRLHRRRHRRGVGRGPRRHPGRRMESRMRRRRRGSRERPRRRQERDSGAATAPESSAGDGSVKSSPARHTNSCGGRYPPRCIPTAPKWAIRLFRDGDGDGTRLEQTFNVVRAPRALDLLFGLIIPAHRDRTTALTEDLRRLGDLAAGTTFTASTTPDSTSTNGEPTVDAPGP